MAKSEQVGAPPLRPEVRPEGLGPDELRPHVRPDDLGTTVDAGDVPEEVRQAATLPDAIPLDETALIGLFNGPQGGSALLRMPGGEVVKVAAGGYVAGGRVTAVDQDGVRLQRGDREVVLTMPS